MKSAKIYTNDLNRLIAATKSFVSDNDHRPCNQYIKLEFHAPDNQVVAMAVDGYRMSLLLAIATRTLWHSSRAIPNFRRSSTQPFL